MSVESQIMFRFKACVLYHKMSINKRLALIIFFLCAIIAGGTYKSDRQIPSLYLFELPMPDSLDPLFADKASNLRLARMIYSTPLEINYDGTLVSDVLEKFNYDPKRNSIEFVVKKGRKYANGEEITADDVAFSISRMLFTRPSFPVLKYIAGKDEWLKTSMPLASYPTGIRVTGNRIEILFVKPLANPMYRLSLEVFSIISKKSVDLASNRLIGEPSPSGFYKIQSKNDREYIFEKFKSTLETFGYEGPSLIKLRYSKAAKVEIEDSEINNSTILFGTDSKLHEEGFERLRDLNFVNLPATYFSALNINPKFEPFSSKKCRQKLASIFRSKVYSQLSDAGPTKSYFPSIIPGYLEDRNFHEDKNLECDKVSSISLYVHNPGKMNLQEKILYDSLKEFGFNEIILLSHNGKAADFFADGKSVFHLSSSGFWTFDPVGDLKMYFTPNMHLSKKHMWSDPDFMKLWGAIDENEDGGIVLNDKLQNLNRYVFEDSKFNVYLHSKRFFATKSLDLIRPFPQLLTAPAPWQMFNSK